MTERGRRKTLVGVVVSNKMEKTAVVAVERRVRHPLYRKIIRRTTRYKAHDATNAAVLGDIVRLEETRPLSKEKRWRIAQTLTHGNVADLAPREIGAPEEEPVVAAAPPVAAAVETAVAEAPAEAATESAASDTAVAEETPAEPVAEATTEAAAAGEGATEETSG